MHRVLSNLARLPEKEKEAQFARALFYVIWRDLLARIIFTEQQFAPERLLPFRSRHRHWLKLWRFRTLMRT